VTALRLARIGAIAAAFALVFTLSQRATLAREGQTLPGLSWAIGVLTLIFLVNAYFIERMQGPEGNLRKDLLWGLAAGGVAIILSRL
jgi:hypothetical protein